MVAKDAVYDLRLQMSGQGLPAGQDTGYALLDEQGITTSEFQQQVTYQRALEGELSKTLESLDGVTRAVVHVALPEDEVFVTDQAEPTASVLLDLAPGTQLSGEQIQAVTNLVSSSVQDMEPEQVTVTDSSGQVLSAAGTGHHRRRRRRPLPGRAGLREPPGRQRPDRSSTGCSAPAAPSSRSAPTSTSTSATPPRRPTPTTRAPRRSRRAPPPRTTPAPARRSAASSARRTCPTPRPTPAAGDSTYNKESTTANNAVGETTRRSSRPRPAASTG